jgi:Dyp-type peroxidase family
MNLQVSDIQGNILVGYRLPLVAHLFASVTAESLARCRAFLREVAVTPAAWERVPEYAVNVALTYPGLAALAGDQDGKIRAAFPAFAAGMSTRARLLRDPEIGTWASRHLWVAVHAKDEERLRLGVEQLRKIGPDFDDELRGAAIVKDNHWFEHFGFRDDVSNPVVEGVHVIREPKNLAGNGKRLGPEGPWVPLKAGEFVLGYPNEANEVHPGSELMPLFRNGTFAVFRDLEQDVDAFHDYTAEQGRVTGLGKDDLAAKIVGRHPDGTALLDAHALPNDFDYQSDPKGHRCPLGAHVRRVNRREPKEKDGGRHRLIRRGRPYVKGGANGAHRSRGLYFVGVNASIEDQFEFIQRRWINDRTSVDGDVDPLLGVGAGRTFVIEGQEPPLALVDIPDFVTFRGGEYYFMPGIPALKRLGEGPVHTSSDSRSQSR